MSSGKCVKPILPVTWYTVGNYINSDVYQNPLVKIYQTHWIIQNSIHEAVLQIIINKSIVYSDTWVTELKN